MNVEQLFLLSLFLSIVLLVVALWRRSRLMVSLFSFSGLATVVTLIIWSQEKPPVLPVQEIDNPPEITADRLVDLRPIQLADEGYVTSEVCQKCHAREHEAWHESYHRTMTQVPKPETAIGDFDDRTVTVKGRTYHFRSQGDLLWVNMLNPDEANGPNNHHAWCPIALSTGSHHMQIYWYPAGNSRLLSQVPLVYLAVEQTWVPRNSVFLLPPGDSISSEIGRWNDTCISCHTTHGRPRIFDAAHVDSLVGEFGIACEACHGPGEKHVRHHDSANSPDLKLADPIVNPAQLSHEQSSQVCGRCHSVTDTLGPEHVREYNINGYNYHPGERLGDSLRVIRRDQTTREYLLQFEEFENDEAAIDAYLDQMFWTDGMVRVSGREYNGILESACHQKGAMSCLSCHKLHKAKNDARTFKEWANDQLNVGMESNQACTQCHKENRYAQATHTHHAAESTGSRCYNCHMPHTTYGLLKAIRSHQIDSPNVATSLQTGRPNACNLCHLDQPSEWTARHLFEWYGTEIPQFGRDQKTISATVLDALSGDAGQRALMAWALGWKPAVETSGSDWIAPYLITLLEDPYDAVRFIAARSLRKLNGFENLAYDFVSSTEERRSAAEQALKIWKSQSHSLNSNHASVLIDASGQLQQNVFQRLKDRRDDREIQLSE